MNDKSQQPRDAIGARGGGFFSLFGQALLGRAGAYRQLRRLVFEIVELASSESRASVLFDNVIVLLIILNICAFVLQTVPEIDAAYGWYLNVFEIFSIAIFTVEYLLRLWTAVEVPFLSRSRPWQARLNYAGRPFMIIDLLAILPFYLSFFMPAIDLRALRVLRLIRFFKLSRYSPAMHTLLRVLYNERRSLLGATTLLAAAVLLSSTGMYYIEGAEQPDKFGSVPLAAYWSITTLTTVGYGDATPVTALGQVWSALTMVLGLCILALPVAIIATGFSQEVGRHDFVVTWSMMSRIPLLAELDAKEVTHIMPLLHAHNMPPRTLILAEGASSDAMYFIASGQVELVSKAGKKVYEGGEFFGTVAMLNQDYSLGSYTTVGRARLLKLHFADFQQLERVSPAIGARIRQASAARRDYEAANGGTVGA